MRKNFVISKQSDIDGFNSFKCSLCGEEFKLLASEVQEEKAPHSIIFPIRMLPVPSAKSLSDRHEW